MGDRANIVVTDDRMKSQVWLYTHWNGSSIKKTLANALKRSPNRHSDAPYLARVIFCEMVKDDNLNEQTGYGISDRITDNEHPILVVDCHKQRVFTIEEHQLQDFRIPEGYSPQERTPSMQEFIENNS